MLFCGEEEKQAAPKQTVFMNIAKGGMLLNSANVEFLNKSLRINKLHLEKKQDWLLGCN